MFSYVKRLNENNDIIASIQDASMQLAACVWTFPSGGVPFQVRGECLTQVLTNEWPEANGFEFWLLAGDRTEKPANRITAYYRLWKGLEKTGATVPPGERIGECEVKSKEGVRFFDAIRFNIKDLKSVCSVMHLAQTALAITPSQSGAAMITPLVRSGWGITGHYPSLNVINSICGGGGFLVNCFGEFDDPEVTVAIIGKPDNLSSFMES